MNRTVLATVGLVGAATMLATGQSAAQVMPNEAAAPTPQTHPFTGMTRGVGNPVLAVKVDNTTKAHPQAGLKKADIVYVEQVEGGLTRIMGVFSSQLPSRVGPVRSARISDLHILRQFGRPAFGYSGAQSKLKPEIAKAPLYDVSQEKVPGPYARDQHRPAPYNLFGSPEKMLREAPKAGKAKDIGFRFGAEPTGGRKRSSFSVKYPTATFSFHWSGKAKKWLAAIDGKPDMAAEGGQLGAPTVVVQWCRMTRSKYHDSNGNYTPLIHTTGTGTGVVLRDGKAHDVKWSRPTDSAGTSFTTTTGKPMTFHRGQVWMVLAAKKPSVP